MDNPSNTVVHMQSSAKTKGADPSTLGGRLRMRRKELGWTQTELATAVGTSQAVIQKIENGKSLRPRILEEIAEALGFKLLAKATSVKLVVGTIPADKLEELALLKVVRSVDPGET